MIYELLAALESLTEEELNNNYPQVREPLEKATAELYINWFKNEKYIVLLDHLKWAGFDPLCKEQMLNLIKMIKNNKDEVKPSLASAIFRQLEIQLKKVLSPQEIRKLLSKDVK